MTYFDLSSPKQIVSSLDSSTDILAQLQEIIAPIIIYTLDNLALGQLFSYA